MDNLRINDLDNYDLNVSIIEPVTATSPIRFRRYTLSYSNDAKNIYLIIGPYFYMLGFGTTSIDKIYGQWALVTNNIYNLNLYIFIGNYPYDIAKNRYEIFTQILPLAIKAIINGDKNFLYSNPNLIDSRIVVGFISSHADFNRTINYGNIKDFIIQ